MHQKLRYRGLWVVLLLIYTHTVYAAMSVLNCSYISVHSNGTTDTSLVSGIVK